MANQDDRIPENTAGKWYVDTSCIDCDVCRTTAPNNFKANEDEGYSFVYKQPENAEEQAQCEEAKASCPVEAIGDDAG
jgi:ferredoxin